MEEDCAPPPIPLEARLSSRSYRLSLALGDEPPMLGRGSKAAPPEEDDGAEARLNERLAAQAAAAATSTAKKKKKDECICS